MTRIIVSSEHAWWCNVLVRRPIFWIFGREVSIFSIISAVAMLTPVDSRDYRKCAEVPFDPGWCKVKVISNNPGKLQALKEAGLEIVKTS